MRFLVDNALSPVLAQRLSNAGHDAVHVRDLKLQSADDDRVLALAEQEDRVLVSADTDFGAILAASALGKPSLVLFRGDSPRRPEKQAALLLANLPTIGKLLSEGAIVVFEASRIRTRKLPIGGTKK